MKILLASVSCLLNSALNAVNIQSFQISAKRGSQFLIIKSNFDCRLQEKQLFAFLPDAVSFLNQYRVFRQPASASDLKK